MVSSAVLEEKKTNRLEDGVKKEITATESIDELELFNGINHVIIITAEVVSGSLGKFIDYWLN